MVTEVIVVGECRLPMRTQFNAALFVLDTLHVTITITRQMIRECSVSAVDRLGGLRRPSWTFSSSPCFLFAIHLCSAIIGHVLRKRNLAQLEPEVIGTIESESRSCWSSCRCTAHI